MDLITAIIDHLDNGSEAEAVAVRALCSSFFTGHDPANNARPYGIVDEANWDKTYEGLDKTVRVDLSVIQIQVYTDTRAEAVALLDALDDCLSSKVLTTTTREVLGKPEIDDRLVQKDTDCWRGVLNLAYLMQK